MVDMFGQELHPGDVAFLLDGRNRSVQVVVEVKPGSIKATRYITEKGEPYMFTTKRSPDRVLKLSPQQIDSYKNSDTYNKDRIEKIEKYYASKGYQ